MMHKIRSVMGLRDDEYQLTDSIELDEGFFETVNKKLSKDEINKPGRGSQKPTTVLVMIESKENKGTKIKTVQTRKLAI